MGRFRMTAKRIAAAEAWLRKQGRMVPEPEDSFSWEFEMKPEASATLALIRDLAADAPLVTQRPTGSPRYVIVRADTEDDYWAIAQLAGSSLADGTAMIDLPEGEHLRVHQQPDGTIQVHELEQAYWDKYGLQLTTSDNVLLPGVDHTMWRDAP